MFFSAIISVGHWGGIWETSEASEGIWEAAGKHKGSVCEASGTCLWTYPYRMYILEGQRLRTALSSMYDWEGNWSALECIGWIC